ERALLAGRQPEVVGDEDAERADEHPQHEAQVEVQETGNEGRQVPLGLVAIVCHQTSSKPPDVAGGGAFRLPTDQTRASSVSSAASLGCPGTTCGRIPAARQPDAQVG